MAFFAIVSTMKIESTYLVQPLDWPSKAPTEDESFSVTLRELRKQFKYLRSCTLKKDTTRLAFDTSSLQKGPIEGLTKGILQKAILYLDRNAAESVTKNHFANDFWIWAVDPEYEEDGENQSGCKGYLRVRLQQLIYNFYVARHWYANEVSLKDLWVAAQKDSYNQSFVSLDEEETLGQGSTWEVVTAARSKNRGRMV